MDDMESRIQKAEWMLERHTENIKYLYDTTDAMQNALQGIHQTLLQIKYFAMGLACLYFAEQFGLTAALKILG